MLEYLINMIVNPIFGPFRGAQRVARRCEELRFIIHIHWNDH